MKPSYQLLAPFTDETSPYWLARFEPDYSVLTAQLTDHEQIAIATTLFELTGTSSIEHTENKKSPWLQQAREESLRNG